MHTRRSHCSSSPSHIVCPRHTRTRNGVICSRPCIAHVIVRPRLVLATLFALVLQLATTFIFVVRPRPRRPRHVVCAFVSLPASTVFLRLPLGTLHMIPLLQAPLSFPPPISLSPHHSTLYILNSHSSRTQNHQSSSASPRSPASSRFVSSSSHTSGWSTYHVFHSDGRYHRQSHSLISNHLQMCDARTNYESYHGHIMHRGYPPNIRGPEQLL
jgi:hypothetical protein